MFGMFGMFFIVMVGLYDYHIGGYALPINGFKVTNIVTLK